jgi:hypothetical protein
VISAVAKAVLAAGADDWVAAVEIDRFIQQTRSSADEVTRRGEIVAVVVELLGAGLVEVGSVTKEGFQEWEGTLEDKTLKLGQAWSGPYEEYWEYFFWTNNTELGDEIARGEADIGSPDFS